jgi:hypothetical protein
MAGAIAQDGRDVNSFLLDEKLAVVPHRLGGRAVWRRVKGSLWRRSFELRASGAVGSRWQPVFGCQIVWNRSTRRAGARGGARVDKPRWLRILMITGGSSMPVLSVSKERR